VNSPLKVATSSLPLGKFFGYLLNRTLSENLFFLPAFPSLLLLHHRQVIQSRLKDRDKASRKPLEELDASLEKFLLEHKDLPSVEVKDLRKKRTKVVIGQTLNKMGVVVPYDKQTELGYRPVPLTKSEFGWRRMCIW